MHADVAYLSVQLAARSRNEMATRFLLQHGPAVCVNPIIRRGSCDVSTPLVRATSLGESRA